MNEVTDAPVLKLLYSTEDVSSNSLLPAELGAAYGGELVLDEHIVYANMVATLDGVAAERSRVRSSRDISGGDPSDRFVMGLLRAHADAILIGAGTLRAHPGGSWTPEAAFPSASVAFGSLRASLGRPRRPRLVVVSDSGDLPSHPALDGALVISSARGVGHLHHDIIGGTDVRIVPSDDQGLDVSGAIEQVRAEGYARILTEGGPRLLGSLVRARAVREFFITVSPRVAGRTSGDRRPGIVDGYELAPDRFAMAVLRSVHRSGSFVFLRYTLPDADRSNVESRRSS